MVDVSQYTGLITSEHADKPKFNAMVAAVAQCFVDQQNALGNFIPSFDLDEAVGDQLDTLGAWVGISRRVRTPLTGVYFSLDIAGVGFDQGVWQGPFDPSTGITVLDDDTYRLLIRAKIGANHWDGTLASSAAILNLIFQGGTAPRHLTATNEQFGIGNGVKAAFQLTVGGVPVYSNINVASIYRNDWQGNQLLYATARTNVITASQDLTSGTWGKNQTPTITADAAIAPDGSTTADLMTTSANANSGVYKNNIFTGLSAGTPVYYTMFVEYAGTNTAQQMMRFEGTAFPASPAVVVNSQTGAIISQSAGISSVTVTALSRPGWFMVQAMALTTSAGAANATFYSGTSSIVSNYLWGLQASLTPGAYIPTTTAPVTITDYTVGATGIVSLGQKPVSGAQLTWNGSGDAYPSGTQVFIEDHQDMSISFCVSGKLPSALFLALLSGGYIPIKPEGVHVRDYVTTSVDGSPIFGMDMENQFVSGFDVGAWGTPLH